MSRKNPCALLINDIHVSKDNIPEFQLNWDEALQICKDHDISDIIIGGDVWQARSAQTLSTLTAVSQAITKATSQGIRLLIAEGNHDKVDQESMVGYNHLFAGYKNVEVVDDYYIWDISDDVALFVMSYFPENGSFIDILNDVKEDLDHNKKNVLYIHEGINGGLATPSDDELPANIFEPFDAVLVGHYHNRKRIPDTNIEYIGSSRQHNFGEDEEKGYTILYTDGSYEFVKNQANTRYMVIEILDINDINNAFLSRVQKIRDTGKYKIKVRVSCKSKEVSSIDKQKLLDCGVTKIELVTEQTKVKLTESQSIEKKFDKNGIKEEYSNFCAEHAIKNVQMGLSYLDKIK